MTGRRKWIWMVLAVSAATVCGFGTAAGAAEATTEYAEDNTYIEDPEELEKDAAEEVPDLDKEKADYVAGLIDAIYVQERTADTDAQCEEAKAAWDELTDEQKALMTMAMNRRFILKQPKADMMPNQRTPRLIINDQEILPI